MVLILDNVTLYPPQDTGAAHIQPIIPGNQYGDNYQQSPAVSYRRAYNAPPVYQPVPQSNTPPTMFVPSPETPAPVVSPVWCCFYCRVAYMFGLL